MESFATIVNGQKHLAIVAKLSILDVCGGPTYTSIHYFQLESCLKKNINLPLQAKTLYTSNDLNKLFSFSLLLFYSFSYFIYSLLEIFL